LGPAIFSDYASFVRPGQPFCCLDACPLKNLLKKLDNEGKKH
jgi:hypothetical protein